MENEQVKKIVKRVLLGLAGIILLFGTVGSVNTGERGVHTRFSAVTGRVVGEGIYFKVPLIESVQKMNVQIQKDEVNASAASSDLQTVTAKIALNYHLEPSAVVKIYQTIGTDYNNRVISPAIQEAIKATTAKFTAEELITKREQVKSEAKNTLMQRLQTSNIIVDDFNIIDFDFSKSFNDAIEAKVTAEQNALAAKNKLEQVKFEAQQAVESAKGKAEAIGIEANALQNNPQVLELRSIEKWNGTLPTYMGSNAPLPFINVQQ